MYRIGKGLVAGLTATIVLSLLMVMKAKMGIMPELDLPRMIAGMMGAPDSPAVGWGVHFMIGIFVYGVAIAILYDRLPGASTTRGAVVGTVGWLIMMVVIMPMAGVGLFAMALGAMAPIMTFVLHLIFGAVLGWTYAKLASK